ncbi:AAA family ATPase [Micromonospora aurantiaca]|uniref:AAA family ATPase n=2 Tax=Micromonospora TaxID=1873 RepID=A0ABQ6UNY1_9ACTN|nr:MULTISPECIES: AAA family ATPase [Micromonospora]KAB1118642.1 AAA family ATPase [Micromonospora aurantiaca]OHX07588.1 helicase [Micromonospora sp. WMMB235]
MTVTYVPPTAVLDVLRLLTEGPQPGVVLNSPPGAGKSTAVTYMAHHLARHGDQVRVVAQTNSQVDDLVAKIAAVDPGITVGRYTAYGYPVPATLAASNILIANRFPDLRQAAIVVATAAKWLDPVITERGPWAIIDEAYQMRSDTLLRLASTFERAAFVGDPGQLDPFSVVNVDRWTGLAWSPLQSAVAAMLANNPDIPERQLPRSWRLAPHTAIPVSDAFYPFAPFESAPEQGAREMWLPTRSLGNSPADRAIEHAAANGWAFYQLPRRHTVRTDAEAVAAVVALAVRVLERGTMLRDERHPDGARVTADRVAIGVAHRDQMAAIKSGLAETAYPNIRVDTANRLQGSEYDIVIVLHPLSGRRDATAFHLESGRLCVLTSRHRHACIVVARDGISDLLDAHPSADPVPFNTQPRFPNGWEANQALLEHLIAHRIRAL